MTRISDNSAHKLKAGFEKCGICLINRLKVLDRLLPEDTLMNQNANASNGSEETFKSMDESFTAILKEMRYDSTPGQKRRKKKVQVQPGRSVVGADLANEDEEVDDKHEEETLENLEGDSKLDNDNLEEEEIVEDL